MAAPLPRLAAWRQHPDGRVLQRGQHLVGAVHRAVVDDDDLPVERQVDHAHPAQDLATVLRSLNTGTMTDSSLYAGRVERGSGRLIGVDPRAGRRTTAPCRSSPSRSGDLGSQPSSVRARVMSGRRWVGSSCGSGLERSAATTSR